MGFGLIGLAGMMADDGGSSRADAARARSAAIGSLGPIAPKSPHFAPKAKQVVHLFMNGGPSQVDTFDPKPLLARYHGKPLPRPNLRTERKTGAAMGSPFAFRKYGQSGIEVSELFARTAERHIDDMCIIRSMYADVPNHEPSLMLMNCGDGRLQRPSLGAWITYGLGSENQNLPGFIAMCPGGYPIVATQNWRRPSCLALPGNLHRYPAHRDRQADREHPQPGVPPDGAAATARPGAAARRGIPPRAARTIRRWRRGSSRSSWPIACKAGGGSVRHQPGARSDPGDVRAGQPGPAASDRPAAARARRAFHPGLERGSQPWDDHENIEAHHRQLAADWDQAIAAFLTDLKQRGLLDQMLMVWGGEFGRTPWPSCRALRPRPQPLWLHNVAGRRRLRGGYVHGATDELGFAAVRTRSTSTTSTPRSCICWASTTSSSPTATPAATSG